MTIAIADGAGALDVTRGERALVIGVQRAGQGDSRTSEANDSACVTISACSGVSAKVTGTTCCGSRFSACTFSPPFGTATPTSMMRAPGTTTLDSSGS